MENLIVKKYMPILLIDFHILDKWIVSLLVLVSIHDVNGKSHSECFLPILLFVFQVLVCIHDVDYKSLEIFHREGLISC